MEEDKIIELFNLEDVQFHTEGIESPETVQVLPMDESSWADWTAHIDPETIEINDHTMAIDVVPHDIEIIAHDIDPEQVETIHEDDHASNEEAHDHTHDTHDTHDTFGQHDDHMDGDADHWDIH